MKHELIKSSSDPIPFRQIHLDFHTSEHIPGIGSAWDKKHWQETLQRGHVNMVNVFATCHHGWSYFNTEVGARHPHLENGFDLTRAMVDACHEIGVRTQIYLTVGVNNRVAREHPEWRAINEHGGYYGWSQRPTDAGFHQLCFNTPYLDYVCDQIREIGRLFPDSDGLWLDIIHKLECQCPWCMADMQARGLDPLKAEDRARHADIVLQKYYQTTLAALREVHPTMRMTQNSGHIVRGDRRFFDYVTHLEIESLPTWGWGYDDFPMAAKYARKTGMEFLGMTGKFHTTWGEFGGFKSPDALRYECAAMLAFGAKCSVGDQLHPDGLLDESTYAIIGEAYAEVEAKEPWCIGSSNVADVALLSAVALDPTRSKQANKSDEGMTRMLLESHFLFDVIDGEMEFSDYAVLVLPDEARLSEDVCAKLQAYLDNGGKVLFTGRSPLNSEGKCCFELGAEIVGEGEFSLNFILPIPELRPAFVNSPMVVYSRYPKIRATSGTSLGDVYEPYFERAWNHFCSHQHAPARREPSGDACGVRQVNTVWLPMAIGSAYRSLGPVALKYYFVQSLKALLGEAITVTSNLPSSARLTLTEQSHAGRYVLHVLNSNLHQRGDLQQTHMGQMTMEVIEEATGLRDSRFKIKLPCLIKNATLEPGGQPLKITPSESGAFEVEIDYFVNHQMVALYY